MPAQAPIDQAPIRITVCDPTDELEVAQIAQALQTLIPQLSKSAAKLSPAQVAQIAGHEACTLLVARLSPQPAAAEEIVGAMVLVLFPLPTGQRAWIEDVVVDESARGKGIGEMLNRRAIEIATAAGARTIDLTSRPSRAAANRLYQRLGFEQRSTNVYRLDLA